MEQLEWWIKMFNYVSCKNHIDFSKRKFCALRKFPIKWEQRSGQIWENSTISTPTTFEGFSTTKTCVTFGNSMSVCRMACGSKINNGPSSTCIFNYIFIGIHCGFIGRFDVFASEKHKIRIVRVCTNFTPMLVFTIPTKALLATHDDFKLWDIMICSDAIFKAKIHLIFKFDILLFFQYRIKVTR